MKNSVVIFIISAIFASCAGSLQRGLPKSEEADVPKSVTTYLTERYKDFPGTKLSLVVPDSFSYDAALGGWTSPTRHSWIIASKLQGTPLVAAEIYKTRITDKSRHDALDGALLGEWVLSMNARASKLLKIETSLGGDQFLQYVLFLGDSSSAYRVIGNVHEDELMIAPSVRSSLLGIFFDAERQVGGSAAQTSASPCNCEKERKK